jgi:cellulose synthase/poly-beta-1,6-N-acetylglucosamine synthase-like glycosyltransferase
MTTLSAYFFYAVSLICSIFFIAQVSLSLLFRRKLKKIKGSEANIAFVDKTVSVLIPYYNESDKNIQATLDSIYRQKGVRLNIVLVSDGNETPANVSVPNWIDSFEHVKLPSNMGKRAALHFGAKKCVGDYLVVVDSDTILKDDAILELFKMVKRGENIGCVCGNILLLNENKNLLTKIVGGMYWFAFQMERGSQSYLNSQMVCSGALSMYLTEPYKRYSESLTTQSVFGKKCFAGDDRHMTNLFLINGYGSTWAEDAVAWTNTPESLRGFLNQQLRWARSFSAELLWLFSSKSFWRMRLANQYFLIKNFLKYFYAVLFLGVGLSLIFSHPLYGLVSLLAVFLAVCLSKGLLAFAISKKASMILKTLGIGLFGYAILSPLLVYGFLTFNKSGWLTRPKKQI